MTLVLLFPAIVALIGFLLMTVRTQSNLWFKTGEIFLAAGMFAICFGAAAGKFFLR